MSPFFRWRSKTSRLSDASEEEQMAFLEAVTLRICADGRRSCLEEVEMERVVKKVRWKFDVESRLAEIQRKAIAAMQDKDLMRAYTDDVKAKLPDPDLASMIMIMCDDMTQEWGYRRFQRNR
jgi:hypothetical protein